jgi:hypothetical protein
MITSGTLNTLPKPTFKKSYAGRQAFYIQNPIFSAYFSQLQG